MERLLTASEVAEALGRKPRWVLDEAREGRIASIKVGAAVRFRPGAVDAYLIARTRGEEDRGPTLTAIKGGR